MFTSLHMGRIKSEVQRADISALEGMYHPTCFTATAFSVETFPNTPKTQARKFSHFASRTDAFFIFFLSVVPLTTIDGSGRTRVVMLFLCVVIGIASCSCDGSCLPAGG